MIGKRWREFFSSSSPRKDTVSSEAPAARNLTTETPPPDVERVPAHRSRRSLALNHFLSSIQDESGLSILDLGGICQENVTRVTDLGHRLYSSDFLRTLDEVTVAEDLPGGPSQRSRMEAFLDQTLGYDTNSLDGALVWDAIPFLSRPLLLSAVDRLHEILRPGATMLAMFPNDEKATVLPVYAYRMLDRDSLHLELRGYRRAVQTFNNRAIEQLFKDFSAVKFFLTRDNLREVLISR